MANRRQFIQAGAALSALPLSAVAPVALAASTPLQVYKAVFDSRFEEARVFAAQATARGWTTAAIEGDVTQLWYHDLDQRWRKGPVALVGVTPHNSLFCLERLAWDVGLRVVEREQVDGTPLVAWTIAPPSRTVRA